MKAMIPGREFELRKVQATATLGAIRVEVILGAGAATRAVIPEVIPEGVVGEVILGAEVEGPTGDNETPGAILRTTRKCSP